MTIKNTFIGLLLLAIAGCVPPKTAFYWGNYSSTLYSFKKNPDEKTRASHENELLAIITTAPVKKKQIPPGVYAEYGYMLLQDNKEKEGLAYMEKEEQTYPESKLFIERLKAEYARGKQ